MTEDLFERAKRAMTVADYVDKAGITLFRAGRRLRGECLICGASKGKKSGGAFWVDPDSGRWGCFNGGGECQDGGDIVEMVRIQRGGSRREAAEWIVGPEAAAMPRKPRQAVPAGRAATADEDAARKAKRAASILAESVVATGTLAERYLAWRGLSGWVLEAMCRQLRFHPRVLWGRNGEDWVFAPAMVGMFETPAGPTGGVHLTFLAPDGRGKADLDPAKLMLGPTTDAEGRAGAVWLIGPDGEGGLIVGEGIESTGSAGVLDGRRCRLVATTSLRSLQGGWLADKWGRRDVELVRGDPESPPFTWPLDGLAIDGVLIAVDRDMKPVKVKVRKPMGGTCLRVLGSEDRARICGSLAEQSWRRANPALRASAVRTVAPAPGRDFSDELKERRA